MQIDHIRLRNFRNYADLSLAIPPGVVVFYGPNGQGKTNLMEALHFLMRGESFRPVTTGSLLRHENEHIAPAAVLHGRVTQEGLHHDVKMTFAGGRRQVTWNNNRATPATLARHFPLVLFSPESLAAIKEGPEQRRQLLDDVVMTHSGASLKCLREFKRALKMRNRILKDTVQEKTAPAEARRLLDSLDPAYLALSTELTVARLAALESVREDFKRAAGAVLQLSNVDISVEYVISGEDVRGWSRSDLLSALHKRALELRESELRGGTSLVGPHKHDIRILFSGKDSRFFCSQGQQRALILSFKMAQILYHHRSYRVYPFLLLDDVLSELDPIRRTNLVGFLRDIPAQIFLTTTDLSFSMDFGERRPHVFQIERGTVTQERDQKMGPA